MTSIEHTSISSYFTQIFLFTSLLILTACGEAPLVSGHLDGSAPAHQLKDLLVTGLLSGGYCIEFSDGQTFPLEVFKPIFFLKPFFT